MSNVSQFPSPESVSAPLSQELGSVRDLLHISDATSNDVIESPIWHGYNPKFRPDGTMQLGVGLHDFETRFGCAEISGQSLYVCYAGLKKGMFDISEADQVYSQDLLSLTDLVSYRFRANTEPEIIKARLIGYFAAYLSMKRATNYLTNQHSSIQERKILKLTSAAERPVKSKKGKDIKAQRENTLGDFRFGINKPIDKVRVMLTKATNDMVIRRKESKISPSVTHVNFNR